MLRLRVIRCSALFGRTERSVLSVFENNYETSGLFIRLIKGNMVRNLVLNGVDFRADTRSQTTFVISDER